MPGAPLPPTSLSHFAEDLALRIFKHSFGHGTLGLKFCNLAPQLETIRAVRNSLALQKDVTLHLSEHG